MLFEEGLSLSSSDSHDKHVDHQDKDAFIAKFGALDVALEESLDLANRSDSELSFSNVEIKRQSDMLLSQLLTDSNWVGSLSCPPSLDSSSCRISTRIPSGTVINDQYEIHELLSSGGCGSVYSGYHRGFRRKIAIKTLRFDLLNRPGIKERFEKEARVMVAINHPNVIRIFDVSMFDGNPFLVMDFIEGHNLETSVKNGLSLDFDQLMDLMTDIASALSAVHEQNIIHRDIKPENIMIETDGNPVLMDFGISREEFPNENIAQRITAENISPGTPLYMAPEQIRTPDSITTAVDVYALGLTYYFLITGRDFSDNDYSNIQNDVETHLPQLKNTAESAVNKLSDVILKMLDKECGKRFQNGSEVRAALETCRKLEKPNQTKLFISLCGLGLMSVLSILIASSFSNFEKKSLSANVLPTTSQPSVTSVVTSNNTVDSWHSKPRIFSIVPFDSMGDENSYFSGLIADLLDEKGYELVERRKIDIIIEELNINQTQLVSQATSLKIGKLIGSHIIITGDIARYEKKKYVNVRAFDVETSDILGIAVIEPGQLNIAVDDLMKDINSNLVYRSSVVSYNDKSVELKHGTLYGAAVDMKLRVINIDDDETIALLQISDVQEKAVATILSSSRPISNGMRVEEIKKPR